MPVMKLFDPHPLRLGGISAVWARIWAYMLWPDDEQQREVFRISPYANALSSIEAQIPAGGVDYEAAHWIVYGAFRHAGGWAALATRPRGDEQMAEKGGALRTAAAVLDIIRGTPEGGGSLNKAVHVIQKTARQYDLIRNRTDILAAWKSHRTVAHLGLALIISGEDKFDEDPQRLRRFLGIARDYQCFALSYKPPSQRRPLLDPSEIWTICPNLRLPRLRQMSPLPADMLKALGEYRSPQ